jgi:hypothetical protein
VTPDEEALRRVIDILERLGVPYMLTGSVATSYHGRPRATHDADIVVDPTPEQLETLVADLDRAGFYVDADGARDALRRRRQFNAIEMQYASKIDLIIRKDRAFSHEEFARRQRADLPFRNAVTLVSPEDAVLSKLEWARQSGDSERQLRDASGVLELNPSLDRQYIEHWAAALGIDDLWRRIAGERPDSRG